MHLFQSLSGFLMSCNAAEPHYYKGGYILGFQSLSGFLMSCNRLVDPISGVTSVTVSIPIGFSNEL